jgi:hypothetical protein
MHDKSMIKMKEGQTGQKVRRLEGEKIRRLEGEKVRRLER